MHHGNGEAFRSEPTRGTPAPRRRPAQQLFRQLLISVDDHLVEPPDVFDGRLPRHLADRAPRVVVDGDGIERWTLGDEQLPKTASDAGMSWPFEELIHGPVNYADLMPGTWQSGERLLDMDVGGVAASVVFPSQVFGFAGRRFSELADPELGLALVRAYNDWLVEEWAAPAPHRLIPCQLPWLVDGVEAAREVERNAARGFRAVTFSENPEAHGFPSVYSDHWEPFFTACEQTGTVINLHVGSSSQTVVPSSQSPFEVRSALFPINSYATVIDWLFAGIPTRFPGLRIVLSEGGLGWVAMLADRLDYADERIRKVPFFQAWKDDARPSDVMRRNFWFAVLHDPAAMAGVRDIGIDHVLMETDYPHLDSTWPDCQAVLDEQLVGLRDDEVRKLTHENAAELYRLDLDELATCLPPAGR